MKTIWKYQIVTEMRHKILMPLDAKILTVQNQYEQPCIWAIVDSHNAKEERIFSIYGTGHEHDEINGKYIGTFQLNGGASVFHLFEEKELKNEKYRS